MIKKFKRLALALGLIGALLVPSPALAKDQTGPEPKLELEDIDKLLEDAEGLVEVLKEVEEEGKELQREQEARLEELKVNGLVYYSQIEEPWKDIPYGRGSSGTVYWTGCGPVSMAMVASSLKGQEINPKEMAQFAINNGHMIPGNGGSYHSLFTGAAKAYGLKVEKISGQREADRALEEGKILINNVSSAMGGYWTYQGHYIVIAGKTKDGLYLVNDPASRKRTEGRHSASQVFVPAKALYAFSLVED